MRRLFVDLKAEYPGSKPNEIAERLQQYPDLGESRVHAAPAPVGIRLGPRACGRILALNRGI